MQIHVEISIICRKTWWMECVTCTSSNYQYVSFNICCLVIACTNKVTNTQWLTKKSMENHNNNLNTHTPRNVGVIVPVEDHHFYIDHRSLSQGEPKTKLTLNSWCMLLLLCWRIAIRMEWPFNGAIVKEHNQQIIPQLFRVVIFSLPWLDTNKPTSHIPYAESILGPLRGVFERETAEFFLVGDRDRHS